MKYKLYYPVGYQRLVDERDQLSKLERPEVVKVVSGASLGDRSENADYQYGKKLREIDRRLRFLNSRINTAEIIDPSKIRSDKIQFGAFVNLENEDGEIKNIQIVGVDETNINAGKISWKSPLGKSLLGKVSGDEVETRTPEVSSYIRFLILSTGDSMKFLIREALIEDVESIANVHVESWFETYRGIIPIIFK